jgi:hypothetical protein
MVGKKASKFDINTASKADLVSLNGIGENLAQKIIGGRPYTKVKDLTRISGISNAKLESLQPFLKVETAKKPEPAQSAKMYDIPASDKPFTKVGNTEAFVFLEDRNERQDAFLILFGGFILGLIILLLRRHSD